MILTHRTLNQTYLTISLRQPSIPIEEMHLTVFLVPESGSRTKSGHGNNDKTPRCSWLEGMAAPEIYIALTSSREQYEHPRLGASFFFSRDGGGLASAQASRLQLPLN